ncbi:Gfo/Idh/MocA family oxidoreductase [Paenibacillus sp. JNUCC31]|uniref:Gfo/Idh/MocA family protein n=1 Tax=Paenibacillus sp. JNUCC-31 TaxID=2777983 RepID=UPI001781DF14|nr:Gfo/Idh/MocA family oxidoreductase [Paenibacillus sp. JNUCC-31]QOS79407.1 Gfo/Idh/MocA family oxidoreductase [Paenibacillus sp. JNUCC-31]
MWKIGIVGAGYWSEKHIKAWKFIKDAQITGICDRHDAVLNDKSDRFNIPEKLRYSDVATMLEEADLDVLDIITPPDTHLELVKLAAAAGKHIMCQKPFASSVTEAEEMVRIAEEAGIRLMVTENWRWLEPFQLIKKLLMENTVGKMNTIRYIHTDYYSPRFSLEQKLPQPFFRDMPHLLFFEMGVHWFDTWRFLFGEPERLYAEISKISAYTHGEDSGMVMLGYKDYVGLMDMSWATRRELSEPFPKHVLPNHKEQLIIEGDIATIKLYIGGKMSIIDNTGVEKVYAERTELDYEDSHRKLQTHFIECLNTGAEFQTSGSDNIKTLRLVFDTYDSAANHKVKLYKG